MSCILVFQQLLRKKTPSFDLCSKHQHCFKGHCFGSCCLICPNLAVKPSSLPPHWLQRKTMQTQLGEIKYFLWVLLQYEVSWVPSCCCPGCPICRIQHGTSLTALWATGKCELFDHWCSLKTPGERRDNQWQPTGKGLWIHHLGTELFPTAHHLPFSFKLLTSVPSGGRNLGGTAWHHCFHLPVCMNHQSGSVNHQSPPRVVLYSKYILCCSKVPRQPGPAGAWSAWI